MSQEQLYDIAVGLLAKRDYASGEMRRHLSKQADSELVEMVMERLLSHHYLDDARLAEREISKQLLKLHGMSRIKQELRQKGLDSLVIDQALEDTDVDWFELCLKAKEKKFGDNVASDHAEKAKMVRYLQYRGHSISAILECIS
ncbi:TPA: regulatory protein RecX [Vibrio vulnificus]|uniref:regulatory protein RecX n=1 Tax=Vibrio TaxID=662 RepID=UPI0010528E03|nr:MULTISPECIES: regulatory protein RecX [Vibrio]MCG9694955.1 recombination regulator RecX [Vibrio sp. Isolate22]MDK9758251.1 recombination regulator RecX [Vibrio sp. D173a]TCL22183.1 regulatory protein [Vibrio crassostreae]CAK2853144.1 Regulatory protein RecX [Vibrio crassostreae]CAK3469961.1 Regulatory protein RecX [Vibrio crassostreae]